MKLELKHLAPYLPYGLKFYWEQFDGTPNKPWTLTINSVEFALENQNKPILRPLSDLTKEIEHNGEKFNPYAELYKIKKDVEVYKPINFDYPIELLINTDDYSQEIDLYDGYSIIQKLLEYHFDVFGLIEQNLAIDINTL